MSVRHFLLHLPNPLKRPLGLVIKIGPPASLVGRTLSETKLIPFLLHYVKNERLTFITNLLIVKLPKAKLPHCRYEIISVPNPLRKTLMPLMKLPVVLLLR